MPRLAVLVFLTVPAWGCRKSTESAGTPSTTVATTASSSTGSDSASQPVAQTPPIPPSVPRAQGGLAPVYRVEILRSFAHTPDAFTQGLEYHDGVLFESTGLVGRSSLRRLDRTTGRVLVNHEVSQPDFAEGLSILGNKIYQITWQSGKCYVYDLTDMHMISWLSYDGEGWGLANNGASLIMSDGSSTIRFRSPRTFETEREIQVTDGGKPIDQINELEYIQGEIWANIWHTDRIARIDPNTGVVNAWVDLEPIASQERHEDESVLNGIAFDASSQTLLITGKLWHHFYEVKVLPPAH